MKKCYLFLGFFGLVLGACSHRSGAGAPLGSDTLAYAYEKVVQSSPNCKGAADSTCADVNITYPLFQEPKAVLNPFIQTKLVNFFSFTAKKSTSLQELANNFISLYLADTIAVKQHLPYLLDLAAEVKMNDPSLIVFMVDGNIYDGGAHGSHHTLYVNWDKKNKKELSLSDILINGYGKQLCGLAEKIFRKDENLSDTASLANNYFFKNGVFSLNDNFMITPTGLQYLYNEYEIKSYAQGQTKLFIPYSQIKSLLRANTAVSQYLK